MSKRSDREIVEERKRQRTKHRRDKKPKDKGRIKDRRGRYRPLTAAEPTEREQQLAREWESREYR